MFLRPLLNDVRFCKVLTITNTLLEFTDFHTHHDSVFNNKFQSKKESYKYNKNNTNCYKILYNKWNLK